ncbi:Actin protein 2/3 complex subunit-like protein [Thalictrum thalictroides]|uniref:Actin protein 2/3 complex subunit-like protein n=1 Tax=Thalictrum thalictroides TaxID=46969 RepID=A0A7J6WKF9_THATH|nr:Actin protein 2/3 complex subunit-like protein [Thalictrum thalictroides]
MMDDPFDFNFHRYDPFHPSVPTQKRKKVIGLDDLLTDFYKEKNKLLEKESKRAKVRNSNEDNEDDEPTLNKEETFLSNMVDDFQKQVEEIKSEIEIESWDLRVFGFQKAPPSLDFTQLGSCSLFQSVMNNEVNSVLELSPEKGQSFLEELLINGWLTELAIKFGHVEKSVTTWTFYLMLYSLSEALRTAACNFWCTILSYKEKAGLSSVRIEGFPSYIDLKSALEVYGYVLYSSKGFLSIPEMSNTDCASEGPPQNIRLWAKFVAACCQVRNTVSIFANISEAEELLGVVITFFLDRQLQGLSLLLNECMLSLITAFTDNEWCFSCERVAKSLATRTHENLNCLRLVESISGVDARSKQLRREVAFQSLVNFLGAKVLDGEEILRLLMLINVKDENCNFFQVYIYLALTECWLYSNPLLEEKPLILEMWGAYLRSCSCQISSTNMKSYASKVRNKASFLIQSIGT